MDLETEKMREALSESFGMNNGEFMISTGQFCELFYPDPKVVRVEVMAAALSKLCRFNGHTRTFYSVAQHSVLVSQNCVDPKHALFHDASEAFLGDVIRPIKYTENMAPYLAAEKVWQRVIFQTLGLDPEMPNSVKLADNRMLMTEFRDLFNRTPQLLLDSQIEPYSHFKIRTLDPRDAEELFLERWEELERFRLENDATMSAKERKRYEDGV